MQVEDLTCLLYTSDAADERSSVDLGGRRIIKKKKSHDVRGVRKINTSITCNNHYHKTTANLVTTYE